MSKSTPVSLAKSVTVEEAEAILNPPAVEPTAEVSQTDALIALLTSLAVEAAGTTEPKVFSSGNTGVYISKRLKAPDARALGITMPMGGKLTLTLQAVIVDPANSKDA
jgi:hypothetical protein